jgi:hypothetical protein
MQDIDFDELDRAVSSVLGVSGQPAVATAAPAPKPVFTPAPAPALSVSVAPKPEPVTSQPTFTPAFDSVPEEERDIDLDLAPVPFQVPTPEPAVKPTVTRSPSNPASNVHAPAVSAPRPVSTVHSEPDQPVAEPAETIESLPSSEPQPAFTPIKPETLAPVTPPQTKRSNGRFMDVVHPSSAMRGAQTAQGFTQPPAVAPASPVQTAPELPVAEPAFEMMTFEETDIHETAPLETPFLSDAKVEKRPLGAFSAAEEDQVEEPVVKAKPPMFEPALEISEEALIGATETADTDPKALQPLEMPVQKETPAVASAPAEVTRPYAASITQQYTEQLSSEPEASGSIFDTEAYHQPLAHPKKKTSGLLIVVWILGLLVVGAGIGVAAWYYFFLSKGL